MTTAGTGPADDLLGELEDVRRHTLALLEGYGDAVLRAQPSPDWSPVGWHLGHVAFTEARWLLEHAHGDDHLTRPYAGVFSQETSVKTRRGRTIPPAETIRAYVSEVHRRTGDCFGSVDPDLVRLVTGHAHQHAELMAVVLQRLGPPPREAPWPIRPPPPAAPPADAWREAVAVDGGSFRLGGEDDPWAYDNERPGVTAVVPPYRLGRAPVTCGAWRAFVDDGGYTTRSLWTEAGWRWREAHGIRGPSSWGEDGTVATPIRRIPFDPALPVYGVSGHEAEAFARWAGARLPTEAEWERAAAGEALPRRHPWGAAPPDPARCNAHLWYGGPVAAGSFAGPGGLLDLGGQVWEWTASPFEPHPGFVPGVYRTYSAPYFDGKHRVLKGGSFASLGGTLRCAFRNWYTPEVRDVLAGLRLAWTDGRPSVPA